MCLRWPAVPDRDGVTGTRAPRDTKGGRARWRDRLPFLVDDLSDTLDASRGLGDSVHATNLGEHRLRHGLALAFREVLEGVARADYDVNALSDVGEELIEGGIHRVGQYKCAGDEPRAEDHGESREPEPELVGKQSLDGRLPDGARPPGS